MSSLIEKINAEEEESYRKWFERWYKKQDLERKLIRVAKQGYKALVIVFEKESQFNSKQEIKEIDYINRRLRDDRTIEYLQKKLPGIKVEYEQDVSRDILNRKVIKEKIKLTI